MRSKADARVMASASERTRRKVAGRILPFLFLLYLVAYLDRANIAFAYSPMTQELGFSDAVYGLGTGLFFLGYFLLEIPGALIVERWGARRWIGRIMVSWGLVTILFAFQSSARQFYLLRFLLGAAEAGFFPGVIVYLTHWFRQGDRSRALAGFAVGAPVSLIIGGPLTALILSVHWPWISSWRWMFILQGLLAMVAGAITFFRLPDKPRHARWLDISERESLADAMDLERAAHVPARWWHGFRDRNVLLLCLAHAFANIAGYGFLFWLPVTIKAHLGTTTARADMASTLPFVLAVIAMRIAGSSADRKREGKVHAAVPMLSAAAFFGLTAIPGQTGILIFACLCLTGACIYAWIPGFWLLPTLLSTGSSRAASIGLINSVGNVGGFLGPVIIGYLRAATYSNWPLVVLVSASYCAAATCVLVLRSKTIESSPQY